MRRTRRVANRRDFSAFNGERAGVCGSAGPVNNSRVLDQQIVRHPMVPPYLGPARNFERDTRYYSAESKSLRGFLDRGPVDYRREPAPGNRSAAQPVAERREGQRMVLDIEDKDDLRFLVREPRARLECYARRKALGHVVVHAVADLLVLFLVRNVEINFIEIKRHRFSSINSMRKRRCRRFRIVLSNCAAAWRYLRSFMVLSKWAQSTTGVSRLFPASPFPTTPVNTPKVVVWSGISSTMMTLASSLEMKGPAFSVTLGGSPSFSAPPIRSCMFLKPSLPGTSK